MNLEQGKNKSKNLFIFYLNTCDNSTHFFKSDDYAAYKTLR